MAVFSMDRSQNTTAIGKGALGGALSGAATGAAIGSVVPGVGTLIGAGIGALGGALGGGAVSGVEDKEAQRDLFDAKQAAAVAEKNATMDATAAARSSGGAKAPKPSAMDYMGPPRGPGGMTTYDAFKAGL